jgi:hypothetical protein
VLLYFKAPKILQTERSKLFLKRGDYITAVAQLVEALRYKPEGRWFDCRWNHWNFY